MLSVEVQLISGVAMPVIELKQDAIASDVFTALKGLPMEGPTVIHTLQADAASLLVGLHVLRNDEPLLNFADETGFLAAKLVLRTDSLHSRTFSASVEPPSQVIRDAACKIHFKEDQICELHWEFEYHDYREEGIFQAKFSVNCSKVTINSSGKGKWRHIDTCYGYDPDTPWIDSAKEFQLQGGYRPDMGLKLQGWQQVQGLSPDFHTQCWELMDNTWLQEGEVKSVHQKYMDEIREHMLREEQP